MIHRTIKKKLAEKAISIQETPEGSNFRFCANWINYNAAGDPNDELELWGNEAKSLGEAMLAARMATIEHHLAFDQDVETGKVTITVGIKNPRVVGSVEDVADLPSVIPDVLEALTDGETDEIVEADATDAEEEDLRGGSCVPDKYKKLYAEMGHAGTCGDWLADVLAPLVTASNGKLDVDAMEEIARLNSVDTTKLNRTSPGWQGRFRMTSRNMLVKVVAKAGLLHVPATEDGDTVAAPADWLAANQPKTKEPGDKRAARKAKGA